MKVNRLVWINAVSNKIDRRRFLIIAGQPKAGTTSLFSWLSQHPAIRPSTIKETRFFLDIDYPLPRALSYNGRNLDLYSRFFDDKSDGVFLDATPDYMYCDTPLELSSLLPNAKVIIVVRDPIERAVSAFRYFQQRGTIATSTEFNDHIRKLAALTIGPETPVTDRILDHCRVSYVDRLKSTFQDRFLTLQFSDVKADPYGTLRLVCSFLGISPDPLTNIDFRASNRTLVSRWPHASRMFLSFRTQIEHRLLRQPRIRSVLRPISKLVQNALFQQDARSKVDVSEDSKRIITSWATR